MDKIGMRAVLVEHYKAQKHHAELESAKQSDPGVPERSNDLDPITRFNQIVAAVQLMPTKPPHETRTDTFIFSTTYSTNSLPVHDPPRGYRTLSVSWNCTVLHAQGTRVPEQRSVGVTWAGQLSEAVDPELFGRDFEYSEKCHLWMFRDPTEAIKPECLVELNKLEHSLILFERLVKADPGTTIETGISLEYITNIATNRQ